MDKKKMKRILVNVGEELATGLVIALIGIAIKKSTGINIEGGKNENNKTNHLKRILDKK